MPLPYEFLMELKYKNDIESVISAYVPLKKRGRNYVGLCPFHNEKTPSFTVFADKANYHCFGCGAGGDVITFIRQIENLDYMEAVRFLADRAGMTVPTDAADSRAAKRRAAVLDANREAARFFYERLISPEGAGALGYYTSRELTPKTIKHFGLGFAPDGWDSLIKHLKAKGFSEEDMLAADLVSKGRKGGIFDRFRGRLMFPIIDIRGNVIGFSGRAMPGDDKSAKYINTGDTPVYKKSHTLYGMNFAKNYCASQTILVEGNVDVITLHQAGFQNTVAACGTAFTDDQARLIARYSDEIVVALDADAAGKKATDRVLKMLESLNIKAKVLRLPECKDPDEYIKKRGAAAFEKLLANAAPAIEYGLYTAADGIDLTKDDALLSYLKRATESLARLDDPIAVDLYTGRLASKFNVSKQSLELQIQKTKQTLKRQKAKGELREIIRPKMSHDEVNPEKRQNPRAVNAEEIFLAVLAEHPDLYEFAKDRLSPEDMFTEFDKKLYLKLSEVYDGGYAFDISLLGDGFTAKQIGYISVLMTNNGISDNPKKMLEDSISVIKEEKAKLQGTPSADLSDDEWAKKMSDFAKNHR